MIFILVVLVPIILAITSLYIYDEYGAKYDYVCLSQGCMSPPFHHTCFCRYGYYKLVKESSWSTLLPFTNN